MGGKVLILDYQCEKWSAIRPELEPLLKGQWEELGLYREKAPMDMNWEQYAALEAGGGVHVTTARDQGRLVGWYVNFVLPHHHYRTTLYGFNDFYYLIPEYRTGAHGIALLAAMERLLRELGVKCLISISKSVRPVDPVFNFLGWERAGVTYMKSLI